MTIVVHGWDDGKESAVPAELALTEFSVRYGLMDQYHVILGPWAVADGKSRERMEEHGREMHAIPMNLSALSLQCGHFEADTDLVVRVRYCCHTETDHPWAASAVGAARGLLAAVYG